MTKRFLYALAMTLALALPVCATNVTFPAQQITILPFNPNNIGADRTFTVTVTSGFNVVTTAGSFPSEIRGKSGFTVNLNGALYTVQSVDAANSLTLTTNYSGASGSATLLLYKYVLLRVYATAEFRPAGSNEVVQAGAPGTGLFYLETAVSVRNTGSTNIAYVPALTLPATTDSSDQTARYQFVFFAPTPAPNGTRLVNYSCPGNIQEFRLPPTGVTNFGDLCTYNRQLVQARTFDAYTKDEFHQIIPSCSPGQLNYNREAGLRKRCLNVGANLSVDLNTDTISATGGGGGGGFTTGTLYVSTALAYTRLWGTSFLNVDASGASRSVDLTQQPVGGYALDVKKGDASVNAVTVQHGAGTMALNAPGAWARFMPYYGGWRLIGLSTGSLPGGGDLAVIGSSAPGTPITSYTRPANVAYLQIDGADYPFTVNLGTPGTRAVEATKTDSTTNAITIQYGASTYLLYGPGQYAKWVPNGGNWVLWALDPTFGGYSVDGLTYASVAGATYTRGATVGWIDCNATAQVQTITLGTPSGAPVEVRKNDSSTNVVTINYNATSYPLSLAGKAAKFVPDAAGTAWVLWAVN